VIFNIFELICGNLGGIWGNGRSKKTLFFTFCDDFLLFCEKWGKKTVFDGKLRGEKRRFVGFWGLNGDFLVFAVNFGWDFWSNSAGCVRLATDNWSSDSGLS